MLNAGSNKSVHIFFIGFAVLFVASVLVHLGVMPLDGEEPRRAIVSIEMLQSGNFLFPTLFGWEYINKPPVFNWVLAFFMFLTGKQTEWVVRLPSLIFFILWAFVHYQFTKKFFPKNIAALSSLFFLTNFHLFFYALGIGGEIDIFYSFVVYMQIMVLFKFNQEKKWLSLYTWSYAFCAIGFLTKGFPSLLFQIFTLMALSVFNRSGKFIFRWQHLAGLLVFCVFTGGYLYAYSFYGSPQRLLINLLNEGFLKSAVGEHSNRVWRKFFIYPFSFLQLLLPWSLLLLLLLKKHSYRLNSNSLVRFSILFILFNIWIYAFTGRPILRYVYMFIPFCYIIISFIIWKSREEYPGLLTNVFKYAVSVFFVALLVLIVAPFFLDLPLMLVAIFCCILTGFIIFYIRTPLDKAWIFCLGLVLLRLIYAALFIPVQERLIKINYREVGASMTVTNKGKNISFWAEPQYTDVSSSLNFLHLQNESIVSPPFIFYQIPYYSYYHTGQIIRYDTTLQPNKIYLSYRSALKGKSVSVLWEWYDVRQKAEFVLFRIN